MIGLDLRSPFTSQKTSTSFPWIVCQGIVSVVVFVLVSESTWLSFPDITDLSPTCAVMFTVSGGAYSPVAVQFTSSGLP